ncbi:MAG: type VI secretion system baseplate subunit TssF [Syntrophaceae bacterium]
MFDKFYEQELQNLRELAVEFSRVHPAAAPMLSGPSADPDVERLLEGVAFLSGLLNKKLQDDFPEFTQSLMGVVFPHYIRPIPSASIVVFSPKPSLKEIVRVPKGTSVAAKPVDGTSCIFKTCFDLEVHPLRLKSAQWTEHNTRSGQVRVSLELAGLDLAKWEPKRLGFFLGGSYSQSADLYLMFTRYLRQVSLKPSDGKGSELTLAPDCMKTAGFDMDNDLLLYPPQSFSGYRLLHEYFIFPHKFLFLELTGWERWKDRGNGRSFEIIFDFNIPPFAVHKVNEDTFILNATPVINIFRHEAEPVLYDHRVEKVRVRPSGKNREHYQVFSVDSVTAQVQGSAQRKVYDPLELFKSKPGGAAFQMMRSRSPVTNAPEAILHLSYPPEGAEPKKETISMSLTCTNGDLPERLKSGDICMPTSDSPELLDFFNVVPPTSPIDPPSGDNITWRFLSHLMLNFLSVGNRDNLKDLLQLYVFPESRDRAKVAANLKRIEGILDLQIRPLDRLTAGIMTRGQAVEVTARSDHFAGPGDFYIFGSVLDLFLGVFSSLNVFTQFSLKDSLTGQITRWPARIGRRPLL